MASPPTKTPTPPTAPATTPTQPTTPAPEPTIAGGVPLTMEQDAYLANEVSLMAKEKKILLKEIVKFRRG